MKPSVIRAKIYEGNVKREKMSEETCLTSSNNCSITKTMIEVNSSINSTSNDEMDHSNDEHLRTMRLLFFYGTLLLILFCIVAIAVNIRILISLYWIKRPLSPTLHISLSLAGADVFSSTAFGIGLVMQAFIPRGLGLDLSGVGCFLLIVEAIRLGAIITVVVHLVALAINHYLGVLKPLHYASTMTPRVTTVLTIFLWILPTSFFTVYFGIVENEGFQSLGCMQNTFLVTKKFRIMFSFLFFGPFILMVIIYTHILRVVREHQASRLRFMNTGSASHWDSNDENYKHICQQMAKNVKAIHTTLLILGSFMIGWMPATFLFIIVCKDCPLNIYSISEIPRFLIYSVASSLIILKTLVNPIIYAARMHEIQMAITRMNSAVCNFFDLRKNVARTMIGNNSPVGLTPQTSQSKSEGRQLPHQLSKKHPKNENCKLVKTDYKSNCKDDTPL